MEEVDGETDHDVSTTHEELRVVFIDSSFCLSAPNSIPGNGQRTRITNSGNMLDDNNVIGVFSSLVYFPSLFGQLSSRLEQDRVGSDHVINDGRLGDLLGPKLPLRAQVLSIIVTEMVVRRDRKGFDTGIDEEFGQDGFNLSLT